MHGVPESRHCQAGPLAHGLMLDETVEEDDMLSQVIQRPVPRIEDRRCTAGLLYIL